MTPEEVTKIEKTGLSKLPSPVFFDELHSPVFLFETAILALSFRKSEEFPLKEPGLLLQIVWHFRIQ